MLIEDATGSGFAAKVDLQNNLRTYSIIEPKALYANKNDELAFLMKAFLTPIVQDPSVTTETRTCFAYIKNTSDDILIISEIRLWADDVEAIDIYTKETGTPLEGTTETPINMNLGSGKTTTGTFLTGTNITGMSGGTFFDRLRIPNDDADHTFTWPSSIIIPKNQILTLYTLTGGIPIEASIEFYYHMVVHLHA